MVPQRGFRVDGGHLIDPSQSFVLHNQVGMYPGVVALTDEAVHSWTARNLQFGGENTAYADHPHVDQRMWRMIAHVVQQGMATGTLAFNPGLMEFYSGNGRSRSPTPGAGINWCGPTRRCQLPPGP